MGTWSSEFINVVDAPADALRTPGGLVAWILPQLATPTGRQRVLYFPPRAAPWELRSATWPLVLPADLEVRIAPGARVIPRGPGSRLVILGPLVAPVAQIFEVPGRRFPLSEDVGEVDLRGDRVECIYPEWWGAGRGDSEADTQALQQALFVALRRPRPPVIELLGYYTLRRPLVVSALPAAPASLGGAKLRGRFSSGGPACLSASDDFTGHAMVVVPAGEPTAALLALSFDARERADVCLELRLNSRNAQEVSRAPHELRHCVLRGAREMQLEVSRNDGQPLPASSSVTFVGLGESSGGPQSASTSSSMVPQLQVTGCVFTPAPSSVGARLNGPRDSVVAFQACTFVGEALAMIHVIGQGVVLTNCRFHNQKVPPLALAFASAPIWSTLHDNYPWGGIDVYIDREIYTELYRYVGSFGGIVLTPRIVRGALGWVTAQDCRSSSLQFLVTANPSGEPSARGVRDSVLIGVHHRCNPVPSSLTLDQLPPSIQWRASPISGSALTLTGCRFDNLTRVGPTRVSVVGTNTRDDQRPPLFEYGTCSRERLVVTWPTLAINNTDVFLASFPGRVPYR